LERVANVPRGFQILRGVAQEYGFRELGHARAGVSVNSDEPLDLVLMSIREECARGTFSAMLYMGFCANGRCFNDSTVIGIGA
jgi:hypothetical protein